MIRDKGQTETDGGKRFADAICDTECASGSWLETHTPDAITWHVGV